jgi:hypothetical protein
MDNPIVKMYVTLNIILVEKCLWRYKKPDLTLWESSELLNTKHFKMHNKTQTKYNKYSIWKIYIAMNILTNGIQRQI